MQDSILCYVLMPYLRLSYLMEIPLNLRVKEFINLLQSTFFEKQEVMYLYNATHQVFIAEDETFKSSGVVSGTFLYMI